MSSNTSPTETVRLAVIAMELGEPDVEVIERELGDDVFPDRLGFRCTTAARAAALIAARARQKAEAEAEARRREAELSAHIAAHKAKHPVPRGVPASLTPEGMNPAAFMTSRDGKPQYDDGRYVPVPTATDWQFGNPQGGADVGPTRSEIEAAAQARAAERAAKKRGAK